MRIKRGEKLVSWVLWGLNCFIISISRYKPQNNNRDREFISRSSYIFFLFLRMIKCRISRKSLIFTLLRGVNILIKITTFVGFDEVLEIFGRMLWHSITYSSRLDISIWFTLSRLFVLHKKSRIFDLPHALRLGSLFGFSLCLFLSLFLSIFLFPSLTLGRVFYIFVVRFSNGLARVSSASSVAHFEVGTSGGTFAPRAPQCDTTTGICARFSFLSSHRDDKTFFLLRWISLRVKKFTREVDNHMALFLCHTTRIMSK